MRIIMNFFLLLMFIGTFGGIFFISLGLSLGFMGLGFASFEDVMNIIGIGYLLFILSVVSFYIYDKYGVRLDE